MTAPTHFVKYSTGYLTPESAKETLKNFVSEVVESAKLDFGVDVNPKFYSSTKQKGRAAEFNSSTGLYGITFVATEDVALANLMKGLKPNGTPFTVEVEREVEIKSPKNPWAGSGSADPKIRVERRVVSEPEVYMAMIVDYNDSEYRQALEDIVDGINSTWRSHISDYAEMEDEDKIDELLDIIRRPKKDPEDDEQFDLTPSFPIVASSVDDVVLAASNFEDENRFGEIDHFSPDKLTFFLFGEKAVKIDGVQVKIMEIDNERWLVDGSRRFLIDGAVVQLSADESEATIDQHGFIQGQAGEKFIHDIVDKFSFDGIPHVSILWNTRDGVRTGFANVNFKAGSNNAAYAVTQTRFMKIAHPVSGSEVILTSKMSKIQPSRSFEARPSRGSSRGRGAASGSRGNSSQAPRGSSSRGGNSRGQGDISTGAYTRQHSKYTH